MNNKKLHGIKDPSASDINIRSIDCCMREREGMAWKRIKEDRIRVDLEKELKRTRKRCHLLESQHLEMRELLYMQNSGISLMRLSTLWSLAFIVSYALYLFYDIFIIHPSINILGLTCSISFFSMGALKFRKMKKYD